MAFGLVAVFGVLGVLARYSVSGWATWQGISISILFVNVVGSFLAGFVYQSKLSFLSSFLPAHILETVVLAALVGFLGGFTTFSAFAVDTTRLLQESQWVTAISNILINNLFSLVACFFGLKTATYMTQI